MDKTDKMSDTSPVGVVAEDEDNKDKNNTKRNKIPQRLRPVEDVAGAEDEDKDKKSSNKPKHHGPAVDADEAVVRDKDEDKDKDRMKINRRHSPVEDVAGDKDEDEDEDNTDSSKYSLKRQGLIAEDVVEGEEAVVVEAPSGTPCQVNNMRGRTHDTKGIEVAVVTTEGEEEDTGEVLRTTLRCTFDNPAYMIRTSTLKPLPTLAGERGGGEGGEDGTHHPTLVLE